MERADAVPLTVLAQLTKYIQLLIPKVWMTIAHKPMKKR